MRIGLRAVSHPVFTQLIVAGLLVRSILYARETPPVYRLSQDIRFERIQCSDPTAPFGVKAITRDPAGFMWFGTWNGLVRGV